ncbi:MAG TPA: gliding motility lipoprotein GldD [Bacteroidales bacterium]|nr:gliding motility lipoprotein GldD [Bacteroidales bacterium]HPS61493.1 gliding motility lipoprotein GldD [Bacteroidales bacterium]
MRLTFLLLLTPFLFSCTGNYTPKPRGYFRIDLPEKSYRVFDSVYPYSFECPVYAGISEDSTPMAEPAWINIRYRPFNATLHISYKPVHGNLAEYLEDAHTLVNKHIPKASAISQRAYVDGENHVYGLVYQIRGADAASPCQFYLTDSVANFIRGALYFNNIPNNDSLAPVIDFLRSDVEHMISTFRWKQKSPRTHHP